MDIEKALPKFTGVNLLYCSYDNVVIYWLDALAVRI